MNSICFDTETTGLHPNGSDPDEILTISIIGRDGSVLLDERFRPTVKTEWSHASVVNGIYPEDVADLPTIETAIPRLREIFAGAHGSLADALATLAVQRWLEQWLVAE